MRNNKKIITKATAAVAATALTASGLGIAAANSPVARADEIEELSISQNLSDDVVAEEATDAESVSEEEGSVSLSADSGVVTGPGGVDIGNSTRLAEAPKVSMSAGRSLSEGPQVFTGYKQG